MHSKQFFLDYRSRARQQALSLSRKFIFEWLVTDGYFPESHVLPPCFHVCRHTTQKTALWSAKTHADEAIIPALDLRLPKTKLTDRTFTIVHPRINHDFALAISQNWEQIARAMFPEGSSVVSYAFPLPLSGKPQHRGRARSGRMIYQFLDMAEDDLVSAAFRYNWLVKTDVKAFYPSVYTHSIPWALHGREEARRRRRDPTLVGNLLDNALIQANDGCTNGLPIGPSASDIAGEIVLAAVDAVFSQAVGHLDFAAVRFKDDYRFLVHSEADGQQLIQALQTALRIYHLELNDEKTAAFRLPDGLFRPWRARLQQVTPNKRRLSWTDFRDFYLGLHEVLAEYPAANAPEIFLTKILDRSGKLKLSLTGKNGVSQLERVVSMLLLLGSSHPKCFPKVLVVLESIWQSFEDSKFRGLLEQALLTLYQSLGQRQGRSEFPLIWLVYFMRAKRIKFDHIEGPRTDNLLLRSVLLNRQAFFIDDKFKLFRGCLDAAKATSLFDHMELFNEPRADGSAGRRS